MTINNKSYSSPKNINLREGILRFDGTFSSTPLDSDSNGLWTNASNQLVYSSQGADTTLGSAGSLVNFSLNDAYDDGSNIAVDSGAVAFGGATDDSINIIEVTLTGAGTGNMIDIQNDTTGSAGYDIIGTDDSWYVSSAGAALLTGITGCDTIVAASDLALDATSSGTITLAGTSTGAITLTTAVTATASITITGSADSDVFVITDGDVDIKNGLVSITSDDTTTGSIDITASATTGSAIKITADSLTSGSALYIDSDSGASFSGDGGYINCMNGTSSVFKVGRYGTITIAGNAEGTDSIKVDKGDITLTDGALVITAGAFTYTAGDMAMSDGSLSITDADNAATFSVTNNTATTASVFVFAGSGAFTGTTTASFLTVTPSGLTTGTAVYLPVVALTEGTGIQVVGNALTSGQLVEITSSATAIATTGRLFSSVHSGATSTSGVLNEFSSAAADETTILKVTASAALASGKGLHISAAAMTTGSALYINATEATITTGKYIECYDGAADDFSVGKYGATVIAGNATGTDALTLTAGDITLTSGDLTLTDGDITLTANASSIIGTGTGANGIVLKNLKNAAASGLSGTQKDVEIDIGGTPYYFTVFPTKA